MGPTNKANYTLEVPEDRSELIEILEGMGSGTVLFIGDVDSGKTTAVTYIANALLSSGYTVAVVDSDVGQKSILPPGTISLGILKEPVFHLGEASPVAHYFIGITTPAQYVGETVVGVKRLAEMGRELADFVLVDTTGFVRGLGLELKRMKVELLRPDLTVLIGDTPEIIMLRNTIEPLSEVFHLQKSPLVKPHTPEQRRELRKLKWKSYFTGSRLVDVEVGEFLVSGTSMFSGRALTREELELIERLHDWVVFAGWKGEDGYVVVKADVERTRPYNRSVIKAIDIEKLSNLLVGFIDDAGLCRGVGILKWPRLKEGVLQILAPISDEDLSHVREIRFGRIRVTEEGDELELLRREEL